PAASRQTGILRARRMQGKRSSRGSRVWREARSPRQPARRSRRGALKPPNLFLPLFPSDLADPFFLAPTLNSTGNRVTQDAVAADNGAYRCSRLSTIRSQA